MDASDWSKQVIARDKKCHICRSTDRLCATRKDKSIKGFIVENGVTLCFLCYHKKNNAQRPPKIRGLKPQYRTLQKIIDYKNSRNNQP